MNRFQKAGARARKNELLNKGCPIYAYTRITAHKDTKEGDVLRTKDFKIVAAQDYCPQDGKAACHVYLDPLPPKISP